jgi:hypothetical protein
MMATIGPIAKLARDAGRLVKAWRLAYDRSHPDYSGDDPGLGTMFCADAVGIARRLEEHIAEVLRRYERSQQVFKGEKLWSRFADPDLEAELSSLDGSGPVDPMMSILEIRACVSMLLTREDILRPESKAHPRAHYQDTPKVLATIEKHAAWLAAIPPGLADAEPTARDRATADTREGPPVKPIRTTKAAILKAFGKDSDSYKSFPRLAREVGFTWDKVPDQDKRIDVTFHDLAQHEELRPKLENF